MKLYGAIDLNSNNNVTVLIDEQDQVVYQKRLSNDLPLIAQQLSAYRESLQGIVVESTFNWYWLADGLMDQGHRIHLANTAAIQQYEGLKYTDYQSDARSLAHLLRLGVLPEGYIYPKQQRAVRIKIFAHIRERIESSVQAVAEESGDKRDLISLCDVSLR
jgi:transposase